MMLHSRAARTTILATSSALALMTAALGDHGHAEGKLDASYTISFARIEVGDITATVVLRRHFRATRIFLDAGATNLQ